MTPHVALLRAVNVGGTGALPMPVLKAMGEDCGFSRARTWIASGNLLFESGDDEATIQSKLEARLLEWAGKPIEVFVRTVQQLAMIVAANPFPDAHGSRHLIYFRDCPPPPDLIARCRHANGERLALGTRELHVDYGEGIRFTKLKISGKAEHTARNFNTVTKLAELLAGD